MKATHPKETPVGGCLERLVRGTTPKRLRDRRRYWAFINAKDAYPDLTFKEWLTHPHFKESRASCL